MSTVTDLQAAVRLDGICKEYPGVRALDGVSLTLLPGRVHAILGENGAGKSTLVGVAAGSVAPTGGVIELAGERFDRLRPGLARAHGLAIVYQTPALAPSLTVTDAVLTLLPAAHKPERSRATNWLRDHFARLGLDIDPNATVASLSQREAHLVEIAAALASEPTTLVLDEPTEALGAEETEWLFARIQELLARGVAIAYITHRIPEVVAIAEDLTVLRDGRVVGTGKVADFTEDQIVSLIIGRSLETTFPPRYAGGDGEPVLVVEGASGPGFAEVSFSLARGEILGLAGVEGNGQRQLLRALGGGGLRRGSVTLGGRRLHLSGFKRAARDGVVFLPGDRLGEGMFGGLSIRENVVVADLAAAMPAGWTNRPREYRLTREAIDQFAVKTATLESAVSTLSGGSQQKVLLARARLGQPAVLLVEDPTQGVDAGARVEIYAFLREMAEAGVAVIVLSTDAVELEGLCDRVLVFSRGTVRADLAGEEVTERAITSVAVLAVDEPESDRDEAGPSGTGRRRWRLGGHLHTVGLLALVVIMAAITAGHDSSFLQSINISQMLLAASVLVFVGLAQLLVVITGGIDLSIGAVVALSGVVVSFFAGGSIGQFLVGVLAALAVGAVAGAVNGQLVTRAGIPPVIATLVTSVAIVGVAQIMRPQPDGSASDTVMTALGTTVAAVPVMFIVGVVVAVVAGVALARTAPGRALRAAGSDAVKANRMGVNVPAARVLAMLVAGVFAACAGLLLYAQTGIGDANTGGSLTLTSVTVIVIAGVSIFGGSGSPVSVAVAALLVQVVTNSLTFLNLSLSWQYWLQGGFVLVAAVLPMLARRRVAEAGR
jgi:ribose transport system ATP-binding protein